MYKLHRIKERVDESWDAHRPVVAMEEGIKHEAPKRTSPKFLIPWYSISHFHSHNPFIHPEKIKTSQIFSVQAGPVSRSYLEKPSWPLLRFPAWNRWSRKAMPWTTNRAWPGALSQVHWIKPKCSLLQTRISTVKDKEHPYITFT